MKRIYVAHYSYDGGDMLFPIPADSELAMAGGFVDSLSPLHEKELARTLLGIDEDDFSMGESDFIEVYALDIGDEHILDLP